MTKIVIQTRKGETLQFNAAVGDTVMEVCQREGIDGIAAECGGACSCATCHVYVADGSLSQLGNAREPELSMLEFADHVQDNSRLSCQITVTDAMDMAKFVIPPE